MPQISVYVMLRKGRKFWEAQWIDPLTGLLKTKTTKKTNRRDAERFAAVHQEKLNSGATDEAVNLEWSAASDRYESEALAGLAEESVKKWKTIRGLVEQYINPLLARSLDASQISRLTKCLRDRQIAEATVKSHLVTLQAGLNWMAELNLIPECPKIKMPKRVNKSKGRPPTAEEFDRIVAAVPKVLQCPILEREWIRLLNGLWWGGLRLDEALTLSWDDSKFCVKITNGIARIKIASLADKSTEVRTLPIAPEFAAMLLQVPDRQRHGRVFRVAAPGQITPAIRMDRASKLISELGETAKVCVSERPPKSKGESPRKKWASAHDLRRAFGTRWAQRLLPQQLKELMRHKSIQTTMEYYADIKCEDIEQAVQAAMNRLLPNKTPNTDPIPTPSTP